MILKVFTTKREIREYLKNKNNEFLPKITTIGEMLEKIVVVKNRAKADNDLKKIYLFKAIENIDTEKLGIKKDFLDFFKNSEFVLSLFNEIYLEKSSLDLIDVSDTYLEYSEHLAVLKEIYTNYKNLLSNDGLYDKSVIEEYEINENYFENIDTVDINLSGYLSKFDLEVLKKIPKNAVLNFSVTPYNKELIYKMFALSKEGIYRYDLKKAKVLDYKELRKSFEITTEYFSDRMNQVQFVFASIEEMINEGIKPENIAVVLPDETFSEYLKLFDTYGNLNFAMGESFVYSDIYITLEAIYRYIYEKDEYSYKKAKEKIKEFEKADSLKEILDFVLKHSNVKERKLIDEEIYKISKLSLLENYKKEEILHFLLEKFKNLTFDDVKGGKVTVMGVLESRGMKFDGVVITDFNEGVIPNVNDKDFFLNTQIRKKASLPTREQKEALQKNYYYNLFINAKKVKISYVKNEENNVSRFLYELNINEGVNKDFYYKNVLFSYSKKKFYRYKSSFEKPEILTPTKLKVLLECPMKYYFYYVLNIKNEDNREYFGSRFHNAMNEVMKIKLKDPGHYYDEIMKRLLQNVSKKEIFEIKSVWEDKIFEFCKEDFNELNGTVYSEIEMPSKKYGGFVLKARADRIIRNIVYDYKTSKNRDYLKDLTQAEFYKYLMPESEIYFWDLANVKKIKVNPSSQDLENKIDTLKFETEKAENREKCKFCDYAFVCDMS